MDTQKLQPQVTERAYSLLSVIFFAIICIVGLLFIAVLLYQWFTRPESHYSAVTPALNYISGLV